MKSKKAVLDNLGELITALGGIAILIAVIFLIMAETNNQVLDLNPCGNASSVYNATADICHTFDSQTHTGFSATYNATTTTISAAADIPGWLPIVVITVIGGLLLTLVRFFKQQ